MTSLDKVDIGKKAGFDAYIYKGKDLGCTYTSEKTILKVWAPTADEVRCHLLKDDDEITTDMTRGDYGVWTLVLNGDYESYSYVYHVYFGDTMNIATDPYARASTANHARSYVIDLDKAKVEQNKADLSPLDKYTDAIIYELHVRDFSTDESGGIQHKGKFLGLAEDGTKTENGGITGVDYLADLGVTHIQLLPVYDFGTVNEENQYERYNWGYDPVQYNLPEGSYAMEPNNPYSRVIELKQAIAHLHKRGMRVIMDVVYNHMFDREASAFEKIVPGYYFRLDEEGNDSNGSFCGNDLDSTKPMVKAFLMESTRIWIEEYGFDGFRFDLMGILDIDTMNDIANQTLKIDPNAMVYGEGWNMPTLLPDDQKATMMNHSMMPNIAHFSDIFREAIKGGTMDEKLAEGGYGSGNVSKSIETIHLLMGTSKEITIGDKTLEPNFKDPKYTLNYVECHDNHTLWDKLKMTLVDQSDDTIKAHHRFITSIVMLSQGIPFLHAGQEFFRSKQGDHNSYNSSDEVNMIRWQQKDANQESINYVKDLIKLRKQLPELRYMYAKELDDHIEVKHLDHHCIKYTLKSKDLHSNYKSIDIYFNPNNIEVLIGLEDSGLKFFNVEGYVDEVEVSDTLELKQLSVTCVKY